MKAACPESKIIKNRYAIKSGKIRESDNDIDEYRSIQFRFASEVSEKSSGREQKTERTA